MLVGIALLFQLGCSAASEPEAKWRAAGGEEEPKAHVPAVPRTDESAQREAGEGRSGGRPMPTPPQPRRIKYTAQLSLIVRDLETSRKQLLALVESHRGYIAQSDVNGSSGAPRSGRWRIRVPAGEFQQFLEAAARLGIPERNMTDSEDVTAEYVDLEARIKSKKQQEESLRGYLKETKPSSQLKDILIVEQELARVRGEIEQMEGQLRLLANLTELTTITVTMQEVRNYVPPQAPTFAATVASTFHRSLSALIGVGKWCVLVIVAAAPWLPFAALLATAMWLAIRAVLRQLSRFRPLPALPTGPTESTAP